MDGRRVLDSLDRLLHWAVALALVAIAGAVFVESVIYGAQHLATDFMGTILRVLNDLLFVIIILEVLTTVASHFEHRDFALKPFLIVGTISVVRHLLIVGARMSMLGDISPEEFTVHALELAMNGVLTFFLVVAYWITSRIEQGTAPGQEERRG